MDKPSPPSMPDLNQMHRYLLSMHNWEKNMFINGTQAAFKSQTEITASTDLSNAGKFVFNSTTGKANYAYVNMTVTPNVIVWKEL